MPEQCLVVGLRGHALNWDLKRLRHNQQVDASGEGHSFKFFADKLHLDKPLVCAKCKVRREILMYFHVFSCILAYFQLISLKMYDF